MTLALALPPSDGSDSAVKLDAVDICDVADAVDAPFSADAGWTDGFSLASFLAGGPLELLVGRLLLSARRGESARFLTLGEEPR